MNPQLIQIIREFDEATARLERLAASLSDDQWSKRRDPDRWSPAECVEHLNLTGRSYLPILDKAIAEARTNGERAPARYRRDPVGWLLWKTMGPPVRARAKTTAAFVPGANVPPAELISEFSRLQQEQIDRVRQCDGLPIQHVKVQSPFNARVRYNLFSCLSMLPPHQHRHLWQAEEVVKT